MNRSRRALAATLAVVLALIAVPGVSPAVAAPTVTLSGHISLGDPGTSAGLNEVGISATIWQPQWFTTSVLAKTDANGDYQITLNSPVSVILNFEYLGAGSYVDGKTSTSGSATTYSVDTTGIDFTLTPGGEIGGHITDTAGTLQMGVTAIAYLAGSQTAHYSAVSDESGNFVIRNLPAGSYSVKFVDTRLSGTTPNSQQFFAQWWHQSLFNPGGEPPFALAGGEVKSGVDAALVRGALEEVRLDCEMCRDPAFIGTTVGYRLEAKRPDGGWTSVGYDSGSVYYKYTNFRSLFPGDYRLSVTFDSPRLEATVPIEFTLAEGESRLDLVPVTMAPGYDSTISGHVTMRAVPGDVTVYAYRRDPVTQELQSVGTGKVDPVSGEYLIRFLPPGTYTVYFGDSTHQYIGEWYNDKISASVANTFVVAESSDVTGIDATLNNGAAHLKPERFAGSDRFGTSAAIAGRVGTDQAPVFIANGLGYPDALSAAPAAALLGGPLLLVRKDSIPPAIQANLALRTPSRIYVVGGPGVVSDDLVSALSAYTKSPDDIVRISGSDRYETSRAIAREFWQGKSLDTIYLADGRDFPDALSAAGVAGQLGAPVVLVNGGQPGLDAETASLINDLHPQSITLQGGTAVMSSGIEADARALVPNPDSVTRNAGRDRYETSYLTTTRAIHWRPMFNVYLASGAGFADALSGSVLAGIRGYAPTPMFLVPPTCVPKNTAAFIRALDPVYLDLFGGTGALSKSVETLAPCK